MESNIGTCEVASGECLARVSVWELASASLFHKMDGYDALFFLWAYILVSGLGRSIQNGRV